MPIPLPSEEGTATAAQEQGSLALVSQEPPKPKKAAAPDVAEAITYWNRRWVEAMRPTDGATPTLTDADRGQLVRLVGKVGLEATKGLLDRYLADDDPFVVRSAHALKHLPSRMDSYRVVVTHRSRPGNTPPSARYTEGGEATEEFT